MERGLPAQCCLSRPSEQWGLLTPSPPRQGVQVSLSPHPTHEGLLLVLTLQPHRQTRSALTPEPLQPPAPGAEAAPRRNLHLPCLQEPGLGPGVTHRPCLQQRLGLCQQRHKKELDECFLNLPIASLPAQPNWAEQGCLTGFYPARLVWPLPRWLLARQLYFLVLLAAAFMWDELLCSSETQPGAGGAPVHTQVCGGATRQGQGLLTSDIHWECPSPNPRCPLCGSPGRPRWLSTALLPVAGHGMCIQRAAGLLRQPRALGIGWPKPVCPNAKEAENWPHP